LEEILKLTDKDHEDYDKLETAFEIVKEVAEVVVEEVDRAGHEQEKMLSISKRFIDYEMLTPGRTFVMEGELFKICPREKPKKRIFFLFSDILLYAQQPRTDGAKLRVHQCFSLLSLKVKDIPDSKSKKYTNAFEILPGEKKSFIVYAKTPKKKDVWLKNIQKSTGLAKDHNTAIWIPDKDRKSCFICEVKFKPIFASRHHCRQCGEVVCAACSGSNLHVRICDGCVKLSVEGIGKQDTPIQEDDSDSTLEIIDELEALQSFTPERASTDISSRKLSFKKGDIISILMIDDSGWWFGELPSGERGWVPNNYLKVKSN